MSEQGMLFMCRQEPMFGPRIELFGMERANGRHSEDLAVQPVEMRELPVAMAAQPFLCLTDDEAQRLMDALWDAGLRPTAGHGSAGQIEAVTKHLMDMRAIAFKRLGMLPKEGGAG